VDLSFRHDLWWSRLAKSPTGPGRVEGLVVRPRSGERERRDTVAITPERAVEGDCWTCTEEVGTENQVALINVHVLRSVADSDPERMALSGDNLHVDLDLSEENLPPGTHLTIGEVVLCISAHPHRPCRSFAARFGTTAVKRIARANRRGLRGRGVLCSVVRGGTIRVGDAIYVRRVSDWTKND
jgi:MOSC domain-containing protein YiiM